MFDKLKYLLGHSPTRPVFVIGTGRSGTHWLGYSLGDHPEIRATIEKAPMFSLSTKMALDSSKQAKMMRPLINAYKKQLFQSAPRLYVDKSHPNIWLVEDLKEAFPAALFVGIKRNPYATIASMMKHAGVADWHRRWKEFPIPNRFLGISQEDAPIYDQLSLASQCAMRWRAHSERLQQIKSQFQQDVMIISFEDFVHNAPDVVSDLQRFLRVDSPIPVPEVKTDTLSKWKSSLTSSDIANIHAITGVSPEPF